MDVERLYLRVEDVAGRLSLDASTVYKMCKAGEIPSIRIGSKAVRIPAPALEAYLRRLEEASQAQSPQGQSSPEVPKALQERAEALRRTPESASMSL
jgi:excisionase family DNA binding protein